MAATLHIVLRQKPNKQGLLPLCLRITKDRKSSFIHLGIHLSEHDWDADKQRVRKTHPNSMRMNAFIGKKLTEANDHSLELEASKSGVSVKVVKRKIKPAAGATVFAQADLYMANLKAAGKFNQYSADKSRVAKFKAFAKTDLPFIEVTVSYLERFKAWLKAEFDMSERTAINHLVVVRSVFSQAIKAGLVDARHYPFGGSGKVKIKYPDSLKIGLSAEEVSRIETTELTGMANHARNLWLVSFYFAGMRVSDVLRLRWSDFQDNRLHYAMGKNLKAGSLKVPEKVQRILEQYRPDQAQNKELVFPELKDADFGDAFNLKRIIAQKNKTIATYLQKDVAPAAGITKPLTMHIARHTFGNLSGDKIPVQMLQKLYRHSSITTTIGYQSNFINKDADDALDAVIGG